MNQEREEGIRRRQYKGMSIVITSRNIQVLKKPASQTPPETRAPEELPRYLSRWCGRVGSMTALTLTALICFK